MSLNQIAKEFGEVYFEVKTKSEKKGTLQTDLFDTFTKSVDPATLPRRTVTVPSDNVQAYVADHHPGWILESVEDDQAVLIQDASLTGYSFTNPDDGMVYGRTVVEGGPELDDDRLRATDPKLWERISEWPEPWYSLVYNALATYITERYNDIDTLVDEYFRYREIQRAIKDLSTLNDDDLMALEDYLLPGKVSVRLVPPRKAKPEELEGVS